MTGSNKVMLGKHPQPSGKAPNSLATGPLPNFLLVGAMKSGTTQLARNLSAHPECFIPRQKGTHFFDREFDKGLAWYRAQFTAATTEVAIGEASPAYMYLGEAVERIGEQLPEARLLAILRNPVTRAYSHYWHERARGREKLSFEEAIAAEDQRLEAATPVERARVAYIDRGRYLKQLLNICEYFPRDRLHVLLLDDLNASPVDSFHKVCRFLGIDDSTPLSRPTRDAGSFVEFRSMAIRDLTLRSHGFPRRVLDRLNTRRHTSYAPMDGAIRSRLLESFKRDNNALATWLGRDLSIWDT